MGKLHSHPGVSSRIKNGKEVWRYRESGRNGRQINLPGKPGDPEFERAYQSAVEGRMVVASAGIVPIGDARSFGAAWRLLQRSNDYWLALDDATQDKNERYIRIFLKTPIVQGEEITWRDVPVKSMKIKDARRLIEAHQLEHPTKAKHFLVALRKLIAVAIREEWIEADPTYTLQARIPPTDGHEPWPLDIRQKYEARHPIGTAARTCYELAFWLGNRRSDIARLRWEHLVEEEVELPNGEPITLFAFAFRQKKNSKRTGGKEMFLPLRRQLSDALAPLPRDTGHVLINAYGNPFSEKSLTGMMAHWTKQADIPAGYTLHGLRHSFGNWLAENGATARQIQEAMGHSSQREADRYLKKANRKRLVSDAFLIGEDKESRREAARRRAGFRVIE
ncbi:integrase [Sinorhizobium meliloti]|uniref:tyrosine-type recombinase/integrase n=1 Tax=Rhizobium meliloti TaxID=382 RepID=UPI000FD7F440|nr:tyrosine-type recombinase/integrase [Sinorhizobium meliloti]MDX0254292.1 tyrosine-type recombinase/integrase [Sinorhizobium meliloti]RVG38273.1 integrase [Sinorhizobium meliloti]